MNVKGRNFSIEPSTTPTVRLMTIVETGEIRATSSTFEKSID